MNLFFLTETESGCYKWRSAIPGKYLQRRGHTVQVLSNELRGYDAPDALVLSRAHFVEAEKIVEWCKANSIRVVFDTDDALDMVPSDSLYYKGLQPRIPLYKFLLDAADAVTTTTETLATHLRQWNSNVIVIPNCVDPEEWHIQPRDETADIRIGWSGATNHFTDLALVMDAVREAQKKHSFTFVIQGICRDASLEAFYEKHVKQYGKPFVTSPYGKSIKWLLSKLAGIRYEFHPAVDIDDHPSTVCGLKLDIGIAPLLDSAFNRNKSCVKYYE
jgi:glycosyltransferase involved in cell wall biosynthesis